MNILSKITFLKPIINKLSKLLNRRQKIYLILLLILTIGFSLVETIGISVIMPFISLASNPDLISDGWYKKAYDFFNMNSVNSFIIYIGIGIIIFYIFRAFYSVFLTYAINRYSLGMYKYFSNKVFKNVLSISYKAFTQENSAVLMRTIINETNDMGKIALNILQIFAEFFTIILIYAVIVLINWKMTLILTVVLVLSILIILSVIIKLNKINGEKRLFSGRKMTKILKETLGNAKFIKLKGNEENILSAYNNNIEVNSRTEVIHSVLGVAPRNILESLGFSLLVAAIILIIYLNNNITGLIPIITMYALALYRILPSVNRLLNNVNSIVYMQKTMEGVDEALKKKTDSEKEEPVEFNNFIRLENINFEYVPGKNVLKDISIKINKGEKIAFTGESGGGKSTLVDLIIGIHKPDSGSLFIDENLITDNNIRSWRKKIGYIPQNIYLFDGTAAENVSFGSVYNEEKIIRALKTANIWEFLETKEGINTKVGDGGIQLSGGQQQRIAIARAIYDDPDVLVLDEATSALDNETEENIMEEIYNLSSDKTLIVIAHRLSTVERCDIKIRIENGRIEK